MPRQISIQDEWQEYVPVFADMRDLYQRFLDTKGAAGEGEPITAEIRPQTTAEAHALKASEVRTRQLVHAGEKKRNAMLLEGQHAVFCACVRNIRNYSAVARADDPRLNDKRLKDARRTEGPRPGTVVVHIEKPEHLIAIGEEDLYDELEAVISDLSRLQEGLRTGLSSQSA